MKKLRFKAFYNGKWYDPALVGGTLVPQVFNCKADLVNLCPHTEEYYIVQFDDNDEIIGIYGNPDMSYD